MIWCNSDELKCDDRNNPVELRRDVSPLSNPEFLDLRGDACTKCKTIGSLVLSGLDECECPNCHKGVAKKSATGFSETDY